MVYRWLFILFHVYSIDLFGQDKKAAYYDVIQGDSVMIYLNHRFSLTEPECSKFIRLVKLDSNGNYDGIFVDLDRAHNPLARGRYSHGIRHGYFETYFSNGKVKSRGLYKNNFPFDQWEFFYENGLPERTLKFIASDTLLMRFIDKKGNVTVTDGQGRFNGPVTKGVESNYVIAKGQVKNGKPEGRWTSQYLQSTFSIEEFEDGKLIKGKFPNAAPGAKKSYTGKSFLNTFFYEDYFHDPELFRVELCNDSLNQNQGLDNIDYKKLTQVLIDRIKSTIEDAARTKQNPDYLDDIQDFGPGRYISFEFESDHDGNPIKIHPITSWGLGLVNAISSAIKTQANFAPNRKIYFHLLLSVSKNRTFGFKYSFSKKADPNPLQMRR